MKNLKLSLLLAVFFSIVASTYAQIKNHIVYFGTGSAGIHFDLKTNEPRPHTLHSELHNESGCVVTNPSTGQLLFYTDGDTIYNAQHQIMLNGNGLFLGNCGSSASSAVVVPMPNVKNKYYLFSSPVGSNCPDAHLLASIIDMTLDNGLGGVLSTVELINTKIREGMIVISKPESTNSWLIVAGHHSQDISHYVFSVNALGVNLVTTYQFEPEVHSSLNLSYNIATAKMATIYYFNNDYEIRLNSFDPYTGIISSTIETIPVISSGIYDVEFSPDGSKVYYSGGWNFANSIYQYDLGSNVTTTLLETLDNPTIGGGLYTGPDQKIYHIYDREVTKVSVIHNPDGAGLSCQYELGGLELHTKIRQLDFSNSMVLNPSVESDTIRGVINEYAKVISLCGNSLFVDQAELFSVGDTVLIIQMQGVSINTTNTTEFGTITDYGQAGKNEFNVIQSITGNEIVLDKVLANAYDTTGSVQMISVPYLGDAVLDGVTCYPWNGNTGGVLVFSGSEITLSSDVDVSGRGFRGGQVMNEVTMPPYCLGTSDYFYPISAISSAGLKGEGLYILPPHLMRGRGGAANCGGSGNGHNCGGGGGANIGKGGDGGFWHGCPEGASEGRGNGGRALNYSDDEFRVFMGGGGGSGHSNNYGGTSGGAGGGILIIKANSIFTNGNKIKANGESCGNGGDFRDGGGGGGAGGAVVLLLSSNNSSSILIEAYGGGGSTVRVDHGHGGGGGGGILLLDNNFGGIQFNALGGLSGRGANNSTNLATDGESGNIRTQFSIPFTMDIYEPLGLIDIEVSSQCDGTGTIHVEAVGTSLQFSINNNIWVNDSLFQSLTSGEYLIKISNGCAEVEELISVHNYANLVGDILFLDNVVCDSLGEIEILATQGKPPYSYNLIGIETTEENGVFSQLEEGLYEYSITDDRDCIYQESFIIDDESYEVIINMSEDTTMYAYDTIQLPYNITPYSSPYQYEWQYEWLPLDWIDCIDCPNPNIYPEYSTIITLNVIDGQGCEGIAKTNLTVTDIEVYFPNVFSPNGDGVNDFLYPQSKETAIQQLNQITIFNRWGGVVFEKANLPINVPYEGWDGKVNGELVQEAIYVVYYEIKLNNGEVINKATDVLLLR